MPTTHPSITMTPTTLPAPCMFSTDDGTITSQNGAYYGPTASPWGVVYVCVYQTSSGAREFVNIKDPSLITLTS